jgi:hypothetical protein
LLVVVSVAGRAALSQLRRLASAVDQVCDMLEFILLKVPETVRARALFLAQP